MNIQDTFCARREKMLNCLFCNRVVSSTCTALIVYLISLLPPTFNILNANRISAYTYCVVCTQSLSFHILQLQLPHLDMRAHAVAVLINRSTRTIRTII